MLRRSVSLLGGGMVPYHEWHLHEPLLVNYEGWRILDNPKMTRHDGYVMDWGGFGRHLDPIIDDPRLTHQQRVSRLYRWALKEMVCYVTKRNATKFNIGYKVVRARFEKYRYVTDPAMCDLMVRETQKYLRENCNPHVLRLDHRSPLGIACQTNRMFHPDNCQVYDHWVSPETMWYDDAKLHRYAGHHPMNSQTTECHERYGDCSEVRAFWRLPFTFLQYAVNIFALLYTYAFFHTEGTSDPYFDEWNKHFEQNMRQTIEAEERQQRAKYTSAQFVRHDWDKILGSVTFKDGLFTHAGRFMLPETVASHPSWANGKALASESLPEQSRRAYEENLKLVKSV